MSCEIVRSPNQPIKFSYDADSNATLPEVFCVEPFPDRTTFLAHTFQQHHQTKTNMGIVKANRSLMDVSPASPLSISIRKLLPKQPYIDTTPQLKPPVRCIFDNDAEHAVNVVKRKSENDVQVLVESSSSNKKEKKTVSFGTVSVTEHAVVIGDSPNSCFPLSLDWKRSAAPDVYDMDTFEESHREPKRISVEERQRRLLSMGYSRQELRQTERRRKILIVNEWAFGSNKECMPKVPVPQIKLIMGRYLTR